MYDTILFISVAPYEVEVVGDTLYYQEDQLTLNCTSEGSPQLEYSWVFLGDIISNSSILIIDDVSTSDGGDYTCNVTNDAGYGNITVTVYSKSIVIHLYVRTT